MPSPDRRSAARPPRVAGYGRPGLRRTPGPRPSRDGRLLTEVAAWLATTLVAGSFVLLLARHDLWLALPVVVAYGLISWFLWAARLSRRGSPPRPRR